MRITYDTEADALYVQLREGEFAANKEVAEGVILDMGEGGVVLGIEILEASTRLSPIDLAQVEVLMPLERTAA
jgi:uncharacterized protein YuzE